MREPSSRDGAGVVRLWVVGRLVIGAVDEEAAVEAYRSWTGETLAAAPEAEETDGARLYGGTVLSLRDLLEQALGEDRAKPPI